MISMNPPLLGLRSGESVSNMWVIFFISACAIYFMFSEGSGFLILTLTECSVNRPESSDWSSNGSTFTPVQFRFILASIDGVSGLIVATGVTFSPDISRSWCAFLIYACSRLCSIVSSCPEKWYHGLVISAEVATPKLMSSIFWKVSGRDEPPWFPHNGIYSYWSFSRTLSSFGQSLFVDLPSSSLPYSL